MTREMDKFVVKRTPTDVVSFKHIAIRMSTFEEVKRIQNETGASMVELIDAMVKFCADRLVVED